MQFLCIKNSLIDKKTTVQNPLFMDWQNIDILLTFDSTQHHNILIYKHLTPSDEKNTIINNELIGIRLYLIEKIE